MPPQSSGWRDSLYVFFVWFVYVAVCIPRLYAVLYFICRYHPRWSLLVTKATLNSNKSTKLEAHWLVAGGLASQTQRCSRDLLCQILVTYYVVIVQSLFGHVACLDVPWSTSTWCSVSDGGYLRRQKANGQLEKTSGPPSQRLAQQGSGGYQRSTAVYAVEIWDRQGSRSGATVHSDYATSTMMIYRILTTVCQSVAKVPIRTTRRLLTKVLDLVNEV